MTAHADGRNHPLGPARRLVPKVSNAANARVSAALLWSLVVIGAVGGVVSLLTPEPPAQDQGVRATSPGDAALEAAGWAESFLAAYLAASGDDPDSEARLSRFVGYTPDLPAGQRPARSDGWPRTLLIDEQDGVWAVTVGDAGRDAFWQVGVATTAMGLVATGLPTPVPAPPGGEAPALSTEMWATPPLDDPAVATVAGWLAAYACGQGDVTRYIAPETSMTAVEPAVCERARLERWGSDEMDDGGLVVVTEVALVHNEGEHLATFALRLARRAGRWEVEALLPGPPLAESEGEVAG